MNKLALLHLKRDYADKSHYRQESTGYIRVAILVVGAFWLGLAVMAVLP